MITYDTCFNIMSLIDCIAVNNALSRQGVRSSVRPFHAKMKVNTRMSENQLQFISMKFNTILKQIRTRIKMRKKRSHIRGVTEMSTN